MPIEELASAIARSVVTVCAMLGVVLGYFWIINPPKR